MSERDELIECLRVCGACHGCGIGADGDTCTNCGDERQLNRLAASLLERDGAELERLRAEVERLTRERDDPGTTHADRGSLNGFMEFSVRHPCAARKGGADVSYYCENCEERGETTEREVDRLREVVERDRARIAELERGEILADKELMSAIITAVMSSVQSDRDDALRKVQRHIIRVEQERDEREAECEHTSEHRALAERRIVELEAEVARLTAEQDAVSAAIGTNEYMDPPDGGNVSLAEQVRRMRDALQAKYDDIRSHWMQWCDHHALEQYEAMKVERDALLARVDAGDRDAGRYREALTSVRIFVQDCIDNGFFERASLANLYGARDAIDAAMEGGK